MIRSGDILTNYQTTHSPNSRLAGGYSTNPWVIDHEKLRGKGTPEKAKKSAIVITPIFNENPTKQQTRELLRVSVLQKENKEFARTLQELKENDVSLSLRRVSSIDTQTREQFADVVTKNWKLPLATAKGIVLEASEDNIPERIKSDVLALRKKARNILTIQADRQITPEFQLKLDQLNNTLWNDIDTQSYAIRRFTTDNTESMEGQLRKTSIIAGLAIGAAILLEVALPGLLHANSEVARGLLAAGLLVTGQTDDVFGSYLNYSTQHPEEKNMLKKGLNMFKDNKALLPGIIGAGVVDTLWLPDLLASQDFPHRFLAGLLFCATAVTGSAITKAGSVHEFRKTLRIHEKQDDIFGYHKNLDSNVIQNWLKLNGAAWKENQSDKYRKGLFGGLLVSLALSTGLGSIGILGGRGITSAFAQGGIGPVETGGEVAGGNGLVGKYDTSVDNRALRRRLNQ